MPKDAVVNVEIQTTPFQAAVNAELLRARRIHAPLNSLHEAYAVILEELTEIWDQVRLKPVARDRPKILGELVQIAAMAERTAVDVLGLAGDLDEARAASRRAVPADVEQRWQAAIAKIVADYRSRIEVQPENRKPKGPYWEAIDDITTDLICAIFMWRGWTIEGCGFSTRIHPTPHAGPTIAVVGVTQCETCRLSDLHDGDKGGCEGGMDGLPGTAENPCTAYEPKAPPATRRRTTTPSRPAPPPKNWQPAGPPPPPPDEDDGVDPVGWHPSESRTWAWIRRLGRKGKV